MWNLREFTELVDKFGELMTKEELQTAFEEIEEGEVCFEAEGYEDYSSGYWDNDFVYEYEDPQEIGRTYEDAAEFAERCVNDGFYQEAQEMFPRYNSFHEELRRYGMPDTRKSARRR